MKYVMDCETLQNCFLVCAMSEDKTVRKQYVISNEQNDIAELIKWLQTDPLLITFNGLKFDSQITTYILDNAFQLATQTGRETCDELYKYAQHIIGLTNAGGFPPYAPNDIAPRTLDLFAIWHFDNMARRTSLKSLQFNLRYHNVQDMPYSHTTYIRPEMLQTVIDYCWNDVESTLEFYNRSQSEIQMREQLGRIYKTDFTNSSDSSIGEKLFAVLLCKEMHIRMSELKKMRTWRESVAVKDIILPYINFETPSCKELLKFYEELTVYDTNGTVSTTAKLGGLKIDYGAGGIHACTRPGIYEVSDDDIILDIDVTSFYPNLAIVNGFRPRHLGTSFTQIYSDIFDQRTKIPKSDPKNKAFKLMLNSVFGKSNSQFSYLYDPAFTLQITINGQLLITMLAEKLSPLVEILQINTDGLTVRYNPKTTDIGPILQWWQDLTKLNLESAYYQKMVIRDVNNYLAVKTDGEVKKKGCFVDKPEWHQNASFLVVPKALEAYYLHGIPPEEFVKNHNDPFDYMGRQKFNSASKGYIHKMNGTKVEQLDLGKVVRYYASKGGQPLRKHILLKGETPREILLHEGQNVTVTNTYSSDTKLDINERFYLDAIYRIIRQIEPNKSIHGEQLGLF